ncbi:MAG: response regulator [Myxococcota bacterium]
MPKYEVPTHVRLPDGEVAPIHTLLESQIWVETGLRLSRGELLDLRFVSSVEPAIQARCEVLQSSPQALGLELTGGTVESVRTAIADWAQGRMAEISSTEDLGSSAEKVLVVEDDLKLGQLLKRALEHRRFEVLLASSAAQGRRLFDAHEVDVVLLDWMLPKESGETVLRHVKTARPRTQVAVVSGVASLAATRDALQRLGADEIFVKPFSLAAISRWVADAMNR